MFRTPCRPMISERRLILSDRIFFLRMYPLGAEPLLHLSVSIYLLSVHFWQSGSHKRKNTSRVVHILRVPSAVLASNDMPRRIESFFPSSTVTSNCRFVVHSMWYVALGVCLQTMSEKLPVRVAAPRFEPTPKHQKCCEVITGPLQPGTCIF